MSPTHLQYAFSIISSVTSSGSFSRASTALPTCLTDVLKLESSAGFLAVPTCLETQFKLSVNAEDQANLLDPAIVMFLEVWVLLTGLAAVALLILSTGR